MFQGVGIKSKEKIYNVRKQSVRHAKFNSVEEIQIRRAGRQNTDAITGVYFSYLSRAFIRSIAGFPMKKKSYFLFYAREMPGDAFCLKIWFETDVWFYRMETYHLDRDDNEVVRQNFASSEFLRLFRAFRMILLQDLVILRKEFSFYPLWKDFLFNYEEYRRFAARVESSLVNVVVFDQLIM